MTIASRCPAQYELEQQGNRSAVWWCKTERGAACSVALSISLAQNGLLLHPLAFIAALIFLLVLLRKCSANTYVDTRPCGV